MGSCFSPGTNKILIYVDIVDQIYAEVDKLHYTEDTLSLYDHIKEKISKKGLFRKLTDHLLSHRNNLNDCMMHNFRMLRQKKTLQCRYTALIIIDQLIGHIQSLTRQQILKPKTAVERNAKKKNEKEIVTVNRDLDVKFETIYFQMILEMFQKQQRLRDKIMQSLLTFASKRSENFNSDKLVWQMLDKLLDLIKLNNELPECTKTYAELLQKSNQNIQKNESKEQSLRVFLNLWMKEKHADNIKQNCENILKIYISRCLTSRQYGFIYNVIFEIYDSYKFKQQDLIELEDKILNLIKMEDLRDHFLKGMFKHLLTYLCMCNNDYIKHRWEDGLFDVHFEALKIKYKNILKKQNKNNGFNTLHRWIDKSLVNTNELISFNRNSFVFCFIFNIEIFIAEKEIMNNILNIFYNIGQKCDDASKFMLFQFLIEQIYMSNQSRIQQISVYVKICKTYLKQQPNFIKKYTEPSYLFFKQIKYIFPNQTKNEIIELDCQLLDHYPQNFSTSLVEALCNVIYSFYSNLQLQDTIQQKYYFICSMLSFFRKLKQKKQILLLRVFLEKLMIPNDQIKYHSLIKRYFQRFIALEIYSILELHQKQIPEEMRRINIKIYSHDHNDILNEIQKYLFNNPTFQIKFFIQDNQQASTIKKYEFILKQFQRCERNTKVYKEEDLELNFMTNTGNLNQRKSSVLSYESSCRADESFQGIYSMIHQTNEPLNFKLILE